MNAVDVEMKITSRNKATEVLHRNHHNQLEVWWLLWDE